MALKHLIKEIESKNISDMSKEIAIRYLKKMVLSSIQRKKCNYHRNWNSLLSAFNWSKTPQGTKFWGEINDVWQTKQLKQKEIIMDSASLFFSIICCLCILVFIQIFTTTAKRQGSKEKLSKLQIIVLAILLFVIMLMFIISYTAIGWKEY